MAAIVTTLLCVPAAVLIAGMLFFSGIPFPSLVTFGDALHPVAGLFAWWALCFFPALLYSGIVVPWNRKGA